MKKGSSSVAISITVDECHRHHQEAKEVSKKSLGARALLSTLRSSAWVTHDKWRRCCHHSAHFQYTVVFIYQFLIPVCHIYNVCVEAPAAAASSKGSNPIIYVPFSISRGFCVSRSTSASFAFSPTLCTFPTLYTAAATAASKRSGFSVYNRRRVVFAVYIHCICI